MSDSRPVLAASGVTRTYRLPRASLFGGRAERHALRGVDLELGENATLGVVGESGSGKSTLVRILLGLDRATAGTVSYRGRDIRPGRPRQLALVPAGGAGRVPGPAQLARPEDDRRAGGQRTAHLPGRRGRPPPSGRRGARIGRDRSVDEGPLPARVLRRPAAADRDRPGDRARPTVLVGDEPVSALDVSVRAQILDLLRELVAEYRLSLILVSHDLGVVQSLCDDVLVLNEGQVVERGPASDVFTRPSHPYTQRLVAAVPRLPV